MSGVPLFQLVNVVTVAMALMFAAYFQLPRFRIRPETRFLTLVFLLLAVIKLDQIYQFMNGLRVAPEYGFWLAPFQWLMTPALYFYVREKTAGETRLSYTHLLHLLPFIIMALYFTFSFYILSVSAKSELIENGWLAAPVNAVFIPLAGDVLQISYLVAAFLLLRKHGARLRDWFANIERRELKPLRHIINLWAAIFLFHFAWIILRALGVELPFVLIIISLMDVLHLGIVITLAGTAIADHFELPKDTAQIVEVMKGSQLHEKERVAFFEVLIAHMQEQKPYLANDLTLAVLADALAMTPRELSEVINRQANKNFFEFINAYRIDAAKAMLLEDKNMRILEIAYACGFNSKSAFNDAFRKVTGVSPSIYRKN